MEEDSRLSQEGRPGNRGMQPAGGEQTVQIMTLSSGMKGGEQGVKERLAVKERVKTSVFVQRRLQKEHRHVVASRGGKTPLGSNTPVLNHSGNTE